MTTPSKRKGDAAELEAARLLAQLTGWPVRRRLGAGRADDCGDLDGIPDSCVQVKHYRDITRAINEILTELPVQQTNAGTPYAFGLVRRPGGRWFAVLDLPNLCALLREATEPEWETFPVEIGPAFAGGTIPSRNHPTRRELRKRAGLE